MKAVRRKAWSAQYCDAPPISPDTNVGPGLKLPLVPLKDGFETVEEMEAGLGMPEGSLVATVARYNEHAARGEDPLFHKSPDYLAPLTTPPYALSSYRLSDLKPPVFTLGGLDVRPTGEVLDSDGDPIAGLYAAGRTVAGIPRNSQGYASGMSVADVTYFGRLAGIQAAAAAPA